MAKIETLEQVIKLLIEDTKQYRQRADKRAEEFEQSVLQTHTEIKLELTTLAKQSQEEVRQSREESKKAHEESDEKFKQEMIASRQEMDRQVSRLNKQMGDLSAKMGTLVEDLVSPDILRMLRQIAHIPEEVVGVVNVRVKRLYPGDRSNGHAYMLEFDAIAECGDYVLINETKNTFRPEYVTTFLERLAELRDYFPEFRGRQIYGAISSLRIEPSVALHASRQGLFVLSLGAGMLEMKNEPNFQPKPF